MLIELTHTTELTYTQSIRESVMELRVCPAQAEDQLRLSFDLAIGPPAQVHGYFDWLDNHVHAFSINGRHDRIRIAATSIVQTDRQDAPLEELHDLPDRWPIADDVDAEYTFYDFLEFGGPVGDSEALRQLAADVRPVEGEPLGDVVNRVMQLINQRFEYTMGVTTSATPVAEFLEHGKGVCQDFTHVLIGILRALKIPARYVSGIVHAEADPDVNLPSYLGATQTHAWVEAYFPSLNNGGGGWVGLDPTNQCRVGPAFVKVATGRHFADVPPNRGVYLGSASESIDVTVETRRLSSVPPELTAERFRRLDVAVTPEPAPLAVGGGPQQQEQQQQQQQQ